MAALIFRAAVIFTRAAASSLWRLLPQCSRRREGCCMARADGRAKREQAKRLADGRQRRLLLGYLS